MPGAIKPLTPEELAALEVFPLPTSGNVTLKLQAGGRYMFECSHIKGSDSKRLEEFFKRMQNAYAFRYESKKHQFPQCRFDGPGHFSIDAPNRCSARLMIVVLSVVT